MHVVYTQTNVRARACISYTLFCIFYTHFNELREERNYPSPLLSS